MVLIETRPKAQRETARKSSASIRKCIVASIAKLGCEFDGSKYVRRSYAYRECTLPEVIHGALFVFAQSLLLINKGAAVKANDAATMDRILADDFILVDGDGTVSTKADLLNEAKSRRFLYEHQEDLKQSVRLWGNTAVVTGKLWGKGVEGEKPFDWTLWYSDTYVRTPKGWRYVFGQASLPLPKTSQTAKK
jgi:Domain of unknown function (DUF4440)